MEKYSLCCIAMTNYTYTYTSKNIFNTIRTSGHSSLEKYTSHFIWKGCVWEVSWRQNRTATYWPPLLWLSQPFFHVLLSCSTGGLGAQPPLELDPHSSIFAPTDPNFLCTESYYCFTPTQFKLSTVKVDPDLLISSTRCTCYLHRSISSFDSLAGSEVSMQHLILRSYNIKNYLCL